MNCHIPLASLLLQLDVLPRIGIAGRDRGEDVLPLLGRDAGPDRVDERVAEDGHEVVVLEDGALDLLGELLALDGIDGSLVLLELGVQLLDADAVPNVEAAALDVALVPERPPPGDPDAVEDDLHARPLLDAALQPLEEDAALHRLHPRPDAALAELPDEPLAPRVPRGQRRDPVHVEAVRIPRLAQELLGPLHVSLDLGPLEGVLHVVVDPVPRHLAEPSRLGLVHGAPVDSQAHRFAHALVAEGALRVLEAGELEEPRS